MSVQEVEKAVKERRFIVADAAVSKRRNTARFWLNFRKLKDKETDCLLGFVICLKCKQIFKYSRTSSTAMFDRHLKFCGKSSGQPLITGFVSSTKSLPLSAKQGVSAACARYCARDNRSFEKIRGVGFKALVDEIIDVAFKYNASGKFTADDILPHPTTVSRYVTEEAKKIKERLISKTKPILTQQGGGITFDFWEEEYTKTSYLGMLAIF